MTNEVTTVTEPQLRWIVRDDEHVLQQWCVHTTKLCEPLSDKGQWDDVIVVTEF